MRQRGSILIVVLGLLAILAIVGVAFVTMSSIDRSTAANFALQSQFDLAADGAVDYVSHYLVQDLWEWNYKDSTYKGLFLTSARYNKDTGKEDLTDNPANRKATNWDYPAFPPKSLADPVGDTWLCSTIEGIDTPKHMSFEVAAGETAVTLFGMDFGLRNDTATKTSGLRGPDNLHFPGYEKSEQPPVNGIWVPDLVFPYESGIIRVSVTVLDHAALINLNVHGYSDQVTATKWPFTTAACTGKGYFMCDVQPSLGSSQNLFNLIEGTTPPGRWGTGSPVKATGEIVIENPMLNQHAPFTLDEEFELRRLVGTFYTSRLEKIWQTGLEANPNDTNMATAAAVQNRLKFTTVGWTAEIRGDPINTDQDSAKDPTHKTAATGGGTWSATKLDLNDVKNISELDIRTALYEGRVFAKGTGTAPFFSPTMAQFSMNIKGFREQLTTWPNITVNGVTYLAARRQPVLLRVKAYWISNDAGKKEDKWGVRAQVYNPWPQGDYPGKTGATLSTPSMRVRFYKADATTMDGAAFPTSMAANAFYESTEKAFTTPAQSEQKDVNKVLGAYFARLEYTAISGKTITLDWCDTAKVSGVTCFVRRGLTVEEEVRGDGSKQEAKVQVLYVTDWVVQSPEDWTTTKPAANAANKDHPIRFPASVPSSYDGAVSGPLPISDSSTTPKFRAFPRLGDLNQVLCPESDPAANPDVYWPWLDRVAKAPANEEEKHKFNWKDTTATPPESGVSRVNAANVFTVSSMPWLDNIDNDGDGAKDISGTTPDTGKELITSTTKPPENTGRFAGPEIRIAGKINLNTASDATLEALDAGASGIKAAVISARASGPIKSIAQVVEKLTSPGTGDDAKGWIEKRDLAFTRISNIASVRSDTFSIYGTVQYIIPPRGGTTSMRVIKSRRFWALVDRSPSAAYPPTSVDFIHPRVLNFQWLD